MTDGSERSATVSPGPAGVSGRSAEIAPTRGVRRVASTLPLLLAGVDEAAVERIGDSYAESAWMRDERHDALRRARDLPLETNPLFTTYVDLRAVRFEEVELFAEAGDAPDVSDVVPEGAAGLIAIGEDRVVARALSPAASEAGVVLDTLVGALRRRPDLESRVRDLVQGGRTLPADDKLAQIARAMSVLTVLVHVPAGVHVDGPLVIRWAGARGGRGLVARTLIDIGGGATANVLEEQVPSSNEDDGRQSMWWGTTEVVLGSGSSLDVASIQDFAPGTAAFVNRQSLVGRDASLRWALASVGGSMQKSRIDNILAGRGGSVRQAEVAFGDGSQVFDLTTYTRHVGQATTGDILSKGVFFDGARGYFKGMIQIERTAVGTDSFLGEFGMNLSKRARAVAIPSLEIDQPDVRRASHSSSVGPIDEAQVFYLQSRGLPRDLARKFIVMGFLEPVVARIPLPEAQERLRNLLEDKWPEAAAEAA